MDKNKAIVISDILARLPYGPIKCAVYSDIPHFNKDDGTEYVDPTVPEIVELTVADHDILTYFAQGEVVHDIKPYLRPIDTMTKSEMADAIKYICDTDNVVWDNGTHGVGFYFYKSDGIKRPFDDFKFRLGCYGPKNIDWFNKFHFDYRGLIPMGLALPSPEGMYETKSK